MNPLILKILSLPQHFKPASTGSFVPSGKGKKGFFSIIQELMNSVQKQSLRRHTGPPHAGFPLKRAYDLHLEPLLKGLLPKGEPLQKISFSREDLFLVKQLLHQCGLPRENVKALLKGLIEKNSSGEIDLSRFFPKADGPDTPKPKVKEGITLEPSAIPYIESVLRDFALMSQELERILGAATVEGGRLDLRAFLRKLKESDSKSMPLPNKLRVEQFVKAIEDAVSRGTVSQALKEANQAPGDPHIVHRIIKKLESIGVQNPSRAPSNLTSSDRITPVGQNQKPVGDFLPSYLIDQVAKRISGSVLRGERVLKLQLKPPDLGSIKVQMDLKGNSLKLGMTMENSSVKELLLSNIHELREALAEHGVKLESLDVQIDHSPNQSLAHFKGRLKEGKAQEMHGGSFGADDTTEDSLSVTRIMARSDYLLDLIA